MIVFSLITVLKQTQTVSLTALNFSLYLQLTNYICSCFPAFLIFEQQKMQEDCFDVDAYLECGVLLRTFPLHDPNERELVKKLWLPKIHYWLLTPFSTCWCNGPCRKDALPRKYSKRKRERASRNGKHCS